MTRAMILTLTVAMCALVGAAHSAVAAVTDQVTAFATACDDTQAGEKEIAAKAQTAKLTALSKADAAKVTPITLTEAGPAGYKSDAKTQALKSDVTRGWWLDAAHTGQVVYQEGSDQGKTWKSCKVVVHAPDTSVVLKPLLALHPRKSSPDAWSSLDGKTLVVFGQPLSGPADPAAGGDVRVDLDASLPFPDMTFILAPQDPKYAPHTPHPIAVTQAELDAGTAKAGVVTYTRRTPIGG
jgi:hypothetical protein